MSYPKPPGTFAVNRPNSDPVVTQQITETTQPITQPTTQVVTQPTSQPVIRPTTQVVTQSTKRIEDVPDTSASYARWGLLVGVFLVGLVIVVGFFLFFHFIGVESDFKTLLANITTGQSCSGQTCGNGFYCNGNGVCQSGTGEGIGQSCSKDADCTFGLTCLTKSNVCGTDPGNTPVSNFTNQQLVTTSTGTKQYLLIDSSGSFLSPTKPTSYSFDYDSSSGISFNTDSSSVSGSANPYTGQFVGFGTNGELTTSKTQTKLELLQTGTTDIQLVNPTCKQSVDGQPLFWNTNSSSNAVQSNTEALLTFSPDPTVTTTNTLIGNQVVVTEQGMLVSTGTTSKPFNAFFPVPSDNSTLSTSDRCPTTWMSINGANVITFSLESN